MIVSLAGPANDVESEATRAEPAELTVGEFSEKEADDALTLSS